MSSPIPTRYDSDGKGWPIPDWPGDTHKSKVINNAYRNGNFSVVQLRGQQYIFFTCFWCKKLVSSSGVAGDHVTQQRLQNGGTDEKALFIENEQFNLELACNECNSGTRNKKAVQTRGSFKRDRDKQGPQPGPDAGGGGGVHVK